MSRKQELVELCGHHTIRQGCKSSNLSGVCFYRLVKNGVKLGCAASPLLKSEMLDENPNLVATFPDVVDRNPSYLKDEFRDLSKEEVKFVREIQTIHDCHKSKFGEEKRLPFRLANKFGKDFQAYCIENFRLLCEHYKLDTSWLNQYKEELIEKD